MIKKCYSIDEEDFSYGSLEEAVEAAFDDLSIAVGGVVWIWEGDAKRHRAGDFFFADRMIDDIAERAYDEGQEYSEDWIDDITGCANEHLKELQDRFRSVINAWAKEHKLEPTFYAVENVRKINVKLLSKEGDWEVVE